MPIYRQFGFGERGSGLIGSLSSQPRVAGLSPCPGVDMLRIRERQKANSRETPERQIPSRASVQDVRWEFDTEGANTVCENRVEAKTGD
jgi:hypothetical protein